MARLWFSAVDTGWIPGPAAARSRGSSLAEVASTRCYQRMDCITLGKYGPRMFKGSDCQ
jgi:hypothetical protein